MKYRASKCIIKEVPIKEQKEFLNNNHIQGYTPCSVCIGLYYNDKLVYLESFGSVRRNNITYASWDLKRMCGLKDSQIYGGASKLLKYFCENYDIGKGIVTYCDPEHFDGHTYNKIGFKYHHTNPRDYKYVKDGIEYNKQYGMKANIYKRHPEWKTLNLTEKEMMEKDGFERVYHKGVISYTYGCNPDYQIYRIVFEDGSTYVGQHIAYQENDGYVTSSTYYKNGNKVKSREIIFHCKDEEQMDIMETICILRDKAESDKNVNGNLGGYAMNIVHCFDMEKRSESLKKAWANEKNIKARIKPMLDVTTKKVKCLETGEIHTKEEWTRLGFCKAYDCARKARYTSNGYHFVFETSKETLKDIINEEKIEKIINEINRRNKLSKPVVINYISKEEQIKKSRSEGVKKQKETIVNKIHEMGYLTLKEMTAWTERQKRAQEPDYIYAQYKCFKPERNVPLK